MAVMIDPEKRNLLPDAYIDELSSFCPTDGSPFSISGPSCGQMQSNRQSKGATS